MVDFNNDVTVTLDKKDVNVMTIIECHYFAIQNYELYLGQSYNNMTPVAKASLMSRIDTLYYIIRPSLKHFWKKEKEKEKLKAIKVQILSKELDSKLKAFENMQDFLFEKGILKFGKTKKVNTAISDEEDSAKGL